MLYKQKLPRILSDGSVISLERRGFMVAPISLRGRRELTDTRKLLGKGATRLSLIQCYDAWEAQVEGAFLRISKLQARSARQDVAGN
jgi:DNA-binding GntR family transcriptional regulator